MYVCICKGITDKQIIEAVYDGATNFRKVRAQLAVGTGCGQCACEAKVIIQDTLKEHRQLLDSAAFYPA